MYRSIVIIPNWKYVFEHKRANSRMSLKDVNVAITSTNVLVGACRLVFFKFNALHEFNAVVLVACSMRTGKIFLYRPKQGCIKKFCLHGFRRRLKLICQRRVDDWRKKDDDWNFSFRLMISTCDYGFRV